MLVPSDLSSFAGILVEWNRTPCKLIQINSNMPKFVNKFRLTDKL
ncbi:Uncharacterised protein [Bordetella pertussis]|nr:Uncharacterised protein [Bordetella pertussis]